MEKEGGREKQVEQRDRSGGRDGEGRRDGGEEMEKEAVKKRKR